MNIADADHPDEFALAHNRNASKVLEAPVRGRFNNRSLRRDRQRIAHQNLFGLLPKHLGRVLLYFQEVQAVHFVVPIVAGVGG